MSRDYGRVHCAFWESADTQKVSDDARLLALYLLSGPHSTLIGAFRLPELYASDDLHWSTNRVRDALLDLSRRQFIAYCRKTQWVWIRKFLKWNPPEGRNQWVAADRLAAKIPAGCTWRAAFQTRYAAVRQNGHTQPLRRGYEGGTEPLRKGFGTPSKPLLTQDQDQDQDQDQEKDPYAREQPPPPMSREADKAAERRKSYRPSTKGARQCPHDPVCRTFTACRDRLLAEAREAKP